MIIRSKDKSRIVNFQNGVVYQDGRDIIYKPDTGSAIGLAKYESNETAKKMLDVFFNSASNGKFDFSIQYNI